MADILYKEESFQIIGLCMKVPSIPAKGLKEVVYMDALEMNKKRQM